MMLCAYPRRNPAFREQLLARSVEGIFIGYTKSNQIYHMWIPSKPNQIQETRDVRFALIPEKSVSFDLELSSDSQSVDNQLSSDSQSNNNQLSSEISAIPTDEIGDMELQRLIHEQSLLPETGTQSSPILCHLNQKLPQCQEDSWRKNLTSHCNEATVSRDRQNDMHDRQHTFLMNQQHLRKRWRVWMQNYGQRQ